VLAAIGLACLAVANHVIRNRLSSIGGYFWLLAVAAIFLGYTVRLSKHNPEEAIHFIQYGILAVLVFRALTHCSSDLSIYFIAAIICGIIGTIDESIQWITPKRVWDLGDIWINFLSAWLVQVGIALGFRPKYFENRPTRASLRSLCRTSIGAVFILWICLLNTPTRIAWYADRIPGLGFLKYHDSVMLEYGYLYNHQDTGIFRSRFSAEELRLNDQKRAQEAAKILDRYQTKTQYMEFLQIYTPISDPFVHEARVHLQSRDHHFRKAQEHRDDPYLYKRHLNIAYRENQIMERYFTKTLQSSSYEWPTDRLDYVKSHIVKNWTRASWVSRNLVTRANEAHVSVFFATLLMSLSILNWYLGKYPASE
jgi:VanZ family protein